jgi:hypothetical protein
VPEIRPLQNFQEFVLDQIVSTLGTHIALPLPLTDMGEQKELNE